MAKGARHDQKHQIPPSKSRKIHDANPDRFLTGGRGKGGWWGIGIGHDDPFKSGVIAGGARTSRARELKAEDDCAAPGGLCNLMMGLVHTNKLFLRWVLQQRSPALGAGV